MEPRKALTAEQWVLPSPQFRMRRLQVYNWGTFSKLHDIAVSVDGFLFVGRSGSGKSTLLDALSTLLVPPAWLSFNAAAREGDKGRHDRNLPSYIRGAWSDQEDIDSGQIATQYLRPASTWSALALEYVNDNGSIVSLIQLFWLRGSSSKSADVRRHYMIADRAFDIATELEDFDLDIRKLKSRLEDVFHFETFKPYGERFQRLLGIDSELALKLLHKTQSAKNLGDLNEFLRDFMLDKPETFEVAERLVQEFSELDAAHQAVVTARKQLDVLKPARTHYHRSLEIDQKLVDMESLSRGIDVYRDRYKMDLLNREIESLGTRDLALEAEEKQKSEILNTHRSKLSALRDRHHRLGGGKIEQLEREKSEKERERDQRLSRCRQVQDACSKLGWATPDTPQRHAELVNNAKSIVERWKEEGKKSEQKRDELRDQKSETEKKFTGVRKEIIAMQSQPSNIPSDMLELRLEIARNMGILEEDLPFMGELIEVKDQEKEWRGAIERLLRGFALAILVDERHYAAVSNYVNATHLKKRLFYYRVTSDLPSPKPPQAGSLLHKLNLKETAYKDWLTNELRHRFDYTCVDNIRDFRNFERAITREGQIRHGKTRHEKDDRYAIDDRDNWVLGFDNQDKLRLYEQKARDLAAEIGRLDGELKTIAQEKEKQQECFTAAHTMVNLQWQDIDVASVMGRIHVLQQEIAALQSGNRELKDLGKEIQGVEEKISEIEQSLMEIGSDRKTVKRDIAKYRKEIENLELQLVGGYLSERQKNELDIRFSMLNVELTLANLESSCMKIEREINGEKNSLTDERGRLIRSIEGRFGDFKREWPVESANLDSTMASAPEFMQLLQRLESDGLPKYEERFYTMLKEQSTENLATLNNYIVQARKEIRERMELVNESLSHAEFNSGTFLRIEVNERNLPEVREFREQINSVLEYAWSMEREEAETRFAVLRTIVKKLSSQENEDQRWRNMVLDVRQHVEFMGRESDKSGKELEIYRSGAGKSGGQREKLATTCLAAALRYQLGGSEDGVPIYAPVVLDEAFGKADNEFTELAMKIFTTFGFQMIVATPLKSVMTLEPFIGGACFVDIKDRKHSATLQIDYDRQKRRLNLPEKARAEVVSD